MKNKKGQAAMEFLMTYGWAILIVLAAIGALAYFGVLSPNKLLPARTTFQAPIPNVDTAVVTADGNVTIAFRNNVGSTITIDSVDNADGDCVLDASNSDAVVGDGTAFPGAGLPVSVTNGDTFRLRIDCGALVSGERFKSDITFTYTNTDSSLSRAHKGSVEGEII